MNVLVIVAHPLPDSFCAVLSRTVMASLDRAGHEVHLLDLYADGFDPKWLPQDQDPSRVPSVIDPEIARQAELLGWSEWLIFVYPTWIGGQPGMLKGWMDRVMVDGVAFTTSEETLRVRSLLRHIRRISVVTTHGSAKWMNALQGEPGKRTILRGIRSLCHPLVRARWIALYGIDRTTAAQRRNFIRRVKQHTSRR